MIVNDGDSSIVYGYNQQDKTNPQYSGVTLEGSAENFDNKELKLAINYKPWLVTLLFLLGDTLSIFLGFIVSYLIRVYLLTFLAGETYLSTVLPVFWLSCTVILGLFFINRMYPGVGRTGIIELKNHFENNHHFLYYYWSGDLCFSLWNAILPVDLCDGVVFYNVFH
jgi:hypothetical protein